MLPVATYGNGFGNGISTLLKLNELSEIANTFAFPNQFQLEIYFNADIVIEFR